MARHGSGQLGYGYSPSMYAMRGSALGNAFAFSNGMDGDASRGSPLRRQIKGSMNENAASNPSVTSPKRLWSISSPMSSMRGQKGHMDEGVRSPTSSARVAANLAHHSPIRSSPLRNGAAGMLSPNSSASLQMQLAMGGGAGQMGFGSASFGAGLGMGSGLTPGRTPGSLRFSSGLSPGRRSYANHAQMMGMSSAGAAPQDMQQQQQGWRSAVAPRGSGRMTLSRCKPTCRNSKWCSTTRSTRSKACLAELTTRSSATLVMV